MDAAGSGSSSNEADNQGKKIRELEKKRARGEVSCAECRRLKVKCNKKIPCSSCIRRGCHTVCPNGVFSIGEGAKFALSNSRKVHTKLLEMNRRIGQLEDALNIAQATMSLPHQHPLLTKEMLDIRSGINEAIREATIPSELPRSLDEELEGAVASGLGQLKLSETEDKFVGRTTVETQLMNLSADGVAATSKAINSQIESDLSDDVIAASRGFPFMPVEAVSSRRDVYSVLQARLPSFDRATTLAETYLENVNWLPRAVQREQVFEELLPNMYKVEQQTRIDDTDRSEAGVLQKMHKLALLFALFACGAAADLTQESSNPEGSLYIYLAKAALNTRSVFDYGASIEIIQTLQLISTYSSFSCQPSSLEVSWKILSFAMMLATSIGLHRDPSRWGLDERQIQRRRMLFWELISIDKFKSFGTGRPAMLHLREADCEFPSDTEQTIREDGSVREGPFFWRLRFCKEVIGPIAETLSEMRPIKYSEILEFDRKIREFDTSSVGHLESEDREILNGSVFVLQMYKDIVLLLLHRSFFARVMIKHPGRPLHSPFAPSFLASFACAIKLVRKVKKVHDLNAPMLLRMWPFWTSVLISGIIIGSVAARVKIDQLATAALQDLESCIQLFEETQKHPVAKRGLPILLRLKDKFGMRKEDADGDMDLSLLQTGVPFVQADSSGNSKERQAHQPPNIYFQDTMTATEGGDDLSGTHYIKSTSGLASYIESSLAAAGVNAHSREASRNGGDLDVKMLMDWLSSDDATSLANLSKSAIPDPIPSSSTSTQTPLGHSSFETANPSMNEVSPTQSAAWLSQTFGPQASSAAKLLNLTELFGSEGMQPSSFAPPPPLQQLAQPASSSLPPSVMTTLEQSTPINTSWSEGNYNGQTSLGPTNSQNLWNGDDQSLLDAWTQQSASEDFNFFNPGSYTPFL